MRTTEPEACPPTRDVTPELYALAVVVARTSTPELARLIAILTTDAGSKGKS